MKILAIDPGTTQSAFVVWDTEKNDFISPYRGIDKPNPKNVSCNIFPNEVFLKEMQGMLFPDQKIDLIAIEMIQNYSVKVGRSTFETVLFVGMLITMAINCDYHFERYYPINEGAINPRQIKLYGRPTIKGHFKAKDDAMIRASLRMRYGEAKKGEKLEGVKKDIWSALAIAVALTENPNLKEW